MHQNDVTILPATSADAENLLELYAPYVTDTAVTFEYDVPSVSEFSARIGRILQTYPYLVARKGEAILGYAYADAFRSRPAYQYAAESTVYVRRDLKHQGIGTLLYHRLIQILQAQNVRNLYACIASPAEESAFLTRDSVAFHKAMDFREVGTFQRCGFKFGQWFDMIYMEKLLGGHTNPPAPIVKFDAVAEQFFPD